jgi:hypothetical protein
MSGAIGKGGQRHRFLQGSLGRRQLETWRTSWLATGCNKPVEACLEEAVEVGRNDMDGTRARRGTLAPKEACFREWTDRLVPVERQIFDESQEKASGTNQRKPEQTGAVLALQR